MSAAPAANDSTPAVAPRRGRTLVHPLLVLICTLLAGVIVATTAWTYVQARETLLKAGLERLRRGADEILPLLQRAVESSFAGTKALAAQEEIVAFLQHPDTTTREAAERILQGNRRNSTLVTELWDRSGTMVLRHEHRPAGDQDAGAALFAFAGKPPRTAGMQPFFRAQDSALFEAVADIVDAGQEPLGHLVQRRELTNSASAELIERLLGPGARILVGNADGDGWGSSSRWVPRPDVAAMQQGRPYRDAAGELRFGVASPLTDTPWLFAVEAEAASELAPADTLLARLSVVGLALLLFGILGASWISWRFTRPVRNVTEAAEAIAAGRLDQRLEHTGPAEVRRLAEAFNAMADHVAEARRDLEARVARRTEDLSKAMARLHETQNELMRKEKFAALGQLAGGVGHELRNPLGVMTNAIFYLETVLDSASPEVREYLGILRHEIERAEKIISDLLDFGRSRTPIAEPVQLDRLAEDELRRSEPRARIVRDFAPGVPPALADPMHVRQVLCNLLTNAVQAMGGKGGTITLRTRQGEDARVRLEVSDDGPGVPDELRQRIFEPLFTTKARGIGLGLAVSRQLAAMNGGELRLEPATARGAAFTLILPAAEVP